MRTLALAFFVTSWATFHNFGKSGAVGCFPDHTTRNNITIKKAKNRTCEVFHNMEEFLNTLSGYEANITDEPSLKAEQSQEFPERSKFLEGRRNGKVGRKGNSIAEINTKRGIARRLFQGDMVLSKEQQEEVISGVRSRYKHRARNDTYPETLWPDGVTYELDASDAKENFRIAAGLWMNNTCIDFKEGLVEEAEDVLLVFKEHGCWAEVGRQGGLQLLSLGDCWGKVGNIAHEIGHVLGFWHTQSRYDRDVFVTVFRSNIRHKLRGEFARKRWDTNNNYNLTYDYGSIMHYGATAFVKKRNATGKYSMIPKDILYLETLGSDIISFYDLLIMNMYYNCTDACKNTTLCYNGGFPHPRDCSKCICPSGYGGDFCDERPSGCGQELNATTEWSVLEDNLNISDVSPDGMARCAYWIKAPRGKRIEVTVLELAVDSDYGCTFGGVEIKTHPDQRLTGYRFCSMNAINVTLVSNSSVVPVITYINMDQNNLDDYFNELSGVEVEVEEEEVDDDEEENDDEEVGEKDDSEEQEQLPRGVKLGYRYF